MKLTLNYFASWRFNNKVDIPSLCYLKKSDVGIPWERSIWTVLGERERNKDSVIDIE